MSDVAVRIYIAEPDGKLDLLLAADTGYFGGTCPVVGDAISMFDSGRHFRVGSRTFLPSRERDRGWALLVDEVKDPVHLNIAVTWGLDSDWVSEFDLEIMQDRITAARKELESRRDK